MNASECKLVKIDCHDPAWRGYTLEELRFQRAYTIARIEIEKNRLRSYAAASMQGNIIPKGTGGSLLLKLFSAFNYIDYAVLAYKLGKTIFSVTRMFRR